MSTWNLFLNVEFEYNFPGPAKKFQVNGGVELEYQLMIRTVQTNFIYCFQTRNGKACMSPVVFSTENMEIIYSN